MNLKHNICIRYHLGMGDAIICNGLVRQFAKDYDLVVVLAKPNNLESVAYMFRDANNVVVRYVVDDEGADLFANQIWKGKTITLGNGGEGGFVATRFDEEFYRQAGLSFALRWENFHVQREPSQEISHPAVPYIFVHGDAARGFWLDSAKIREVNNGKMPAKCVPDVALSRNIFAWLPAILHAEHIHCIPSSFSVLVDSMPKIEGQKLFLHQYSRAAGELPTYRHDWTIIT